MTEVYINNNINAIKDDIYYLIKNGEISFFYKDFLLFKHNKNNPVVSVILRKGTTEKEVPLISYDINKLNINEYNIEFYHQIYRIKFYLRLQDKHLLIKVFNKNKYYGIKLSIKNSAGKIKGFGLNKEEVTNGKELYSNGYKENEKITLSEDKILAFYKEKKYFLHIDGNYEWKTRIGTLIEMYFKNTSQLDINAIFYKSLWEVKTLAPDLTKTLFAEKKIIMKTTLSELDSLLHCQKAINGEIGTVILCDEYVHFAQLKEVRERLKKLNIKVLRQVQPKISEQDDYFNQFSKDDFICTENGKVLTENSKTRLFYLNLSNTETCRKIKNYIRRILGTNIDGMLSVEKENKIANRPEYRDILKQSSQIWQKIIYDASMEYFMPKTLIFDSLTPETYKLGYFLVAGQKLSNRKYKRQLENLQHSGIFNTVISCNMWDKWVRKVMKKKILQDYYIIYNI